MTYSQGEGAGAPEERFPVLRQVEHLLDLVENDRFYDNELRCTDPAALQAVIDELLAIYKLLDGNPRVSGHW